MATRDVVVAILAKDKAMYLPLYLACLESQTWPKKKTHLYIRSYANMHVETDEDGYFREGPSYEPIRSRTLTGIMNVDVVHCTYMIGWDAYDAVSYADGTHRHEYIVFSDALRKAGVAQYIDNRHD